MSESKGKENIDFIIQYCVVCMVHLTTHADSGRFGISGSLFLLGVCFLDPSDELSLKEGFASVLVMGLASRPDAFEEALAAPISPLPFTKSPPRFI